MSKTYKKYRRGIKAVIFKDSEKGRLFLVLHRIKRWKGFELLKGGKFSSESYVGALKREIREELGCKPKNIKRLPFEDKFDYPVKHRAVFKKKGQISVCYVCEIVGLTDGGVKKIKLGDEHDKYQWVDFKKAMKLLTYNNSKKILKSANSFLKNVE